VKLLLKDFQTDAVEKLVKQLRRAAKEAETDELQSVCISSPTGSGKTVILIASIEVLLNGDDSSAPLPDATFLWITDQPELNEQTRRKMLTASSILTAERLVVIDASFDQETFRPGIVHFLNTQKLGKEKDLVTASDHRTYTMWEAVTNTVAMRPGKFFVIIDEAHRGMMENIRARNEATTIIQKFIKGSTGEIPAVPLILGISATPDRFNSLIATTERTTRSVDVKAEDVRASGLLKEVITLFHPNNEQPTDMTMLRAAVRTWQGYSKSWDQYCAAQGEPLVRPILVVQVKDGSANDISKTDIAEAISVVRAEVGDISNDAFAHSFQEGTRVKVRDEELRYLAPPDVQEDPDVRVVFFKTSLNTGWDCPRAEVMMSFRTAADATLIAQLVGRMVRTPLARRVGDDEFLNTVALYLPHYDEEGLKEVIKRLTKADVEIVPPVNVTLDAITLKRVAASESAFAALAAVPSYEIPKARKTSQVRRLMKLARLLAHDDIDEQAPDKATKKLLEVLQSQYARLILTERFKALVEENQKVAVRAVNFSVGTDEVSDAETIELSVSAENLEDLFEAAGRKVSEGLHKAWWRWRVPEGATPEEKTKAKVEFVALCFVEDDVALKLEGEAQKLVQYWLNISKTDIAKLFDGRRQEYDEIRRLGSEPEERVLTYPHVIEGKKADRSWQKHLYVNEKEGFPQKFNTWEAKVLEAELDKEVVLGWVRNPDRKPWSLRVPYRFRGEWCALYPDFLFVRSEQESLVVDILDPHAISLEDAPAKAVGLAEYAAKHGHQFGRIELIIIADDKMKRLDLTQERVRDKVKEVTTHNHLRLLFDQL
jgi:type III restriction enzyme